MKPPDSIVIGPHRYTIGADEEMASWGEYYCGSASIVYDPDQVPTMLRDTVLHEVLHAITDMAGLHHEFGAKRDERWVRGIAPLLLDALQRNPDLVAFLTERSASE